MDDYIDLLRNKILDLAIRGKLVEQSEKDESASVLIDKIIEKKHILMNERIIKKEKLSKIIKEKDCYYEVFDDGKIKDITDEITFEIPSNWCFSRLKNTSYIISSVNKQVKSKEVLEHGEIPVVSQGQSLIDGYTNEIDKKIVIDSPIIVFGDHTRAVKFIDFDFVAGADGTKIINPLIINPKFYYYLIKYIANNIRNRGYERHFSLLNSSILPIPPYDEQQRIVNKIIELEEKINVVNDSQKRITDLKLVLKDKIIDLSIKGELIKHKENENGNDNYINSIIDKRRSLERTSKDKFSVIFKNKDNQYYEKFEDDTIININDEIPFEIPDSWNWSRLNNIVCKIIKRGKSPKYVDNSNIYVFAQKCNQKNGVISLKNAKFLDETTLKKYEESDFIREKDIVINSTGTGTIGRVGFIIDKEIYQKKVVADSHVTVIRVCDDILSDFIYYYLKSKQKYLELQGTGSTNQKELSPETIKNILVPVPPKDEQISIIHKMEKLLSVIK